MSHPQRTAIITVDLNGQHGTCSHCGQPAVIAKTHPQCGAVVEGVAIDSRVAADPTLAQAIAVHNKLRGLSIAFVGVGLVRARPGGRGHFFERTKRPGDLS